MKALIAIFIIVVMFFLFREFLSFYEKSKRGEVPTQTAGARPLELRGEDLPGLPPSLEPSLQAAQNGGAKALGKWLKQYRPYVQDPRLAWIELDYVVLVSLQDAKEARRIFQSVKDRTPPDSPVYERVKRLERTYR
jgi:hypothetical protein